VHSQSGAFGFKVAEARPDKVKALVAIEPTLGGDKNKVALLKNTPVLIVYGDNAKEHPRCRRSARAASITRPCSKAPAAASTSSTCPTAAFAAIPTC